MVGMAPRSFLSAYLLVGLLNAVAVATQNGPAVTLTKPLLMPLLILWLITEQRRQWPTPHRWLLAGMVFAWIGDMFLMGDGETFFALGIAAFLGTQVTYFVAFIRHRGLSFRRGIAAPGRPAVGLVHRYPLLLVPFAAYLAILVIVLWPTAGSLRIPVAVYGLALTAMAAGALNLIGRMPPASAWVAFGGAVLFVVSDSLIAMTSLGPWPESPALGALVMVTYVVGQGLIAVGLVTGSRAVEELRLTEQVA
jgi:uncharacterized membrane protein YhhN